MRPVDIIHVLLAETDFVGAGLLVVEYLLL